MIQPRPYQQAAADCLDAWLASRDDSPCVVVPTGGGKTIIFATIIQRYLTTWPQTRILVLAHVKELIEQNAKKLAEVWPEAPLGVYSAGLGQRDARASVVFAGVQSVYKRANEFGHFDLVFVDEAHRIPASGDGQYRTLLDGLRAINPHLRVVGFTATPYRLGIGPVCAPDNILNGICFDVGVRDLIDQGYLCPLVSRGSRTTADLSGVKVRQGEYAADQLEEAMMAGDLVTRTANEIVRLAAERKAWLIFCPGKAHATAMQAALLEHGIEARVITDATPARERDAAIAAYRARELRALININVLSEGFDAPHVDCVIMLRPTKSAGLYYQQVGRGLRLHESKRDCLVLDFAKNVMTHGPLDALIPPPQKGKGAPRPAPMKECPECQLLVHNSVMVCPDCKHEFPKAQPHTDYATDVSILKQPPAWLEVTGIGYQRHEKLGRTPTMRVTYQCGLRRVSEWVCIEHEGYARTKAASWWRARDTVPALPVPVEVDDAVAQCEDGRLTVPARLLVDFNGKYPEIRDYYFETAANDGARLMEAK